MYYFFCQKIQLKLLTNEKRLFKQKLVNNSRAELALASLERATAFVSFHSQGVAVSFALTAIISGA